MGTPSKVFIILLAVIAIVNILFFTWLFLQPPATDCDCCLNGTTP